MIVVTVFHLILNQMENCHHDHISFNLKGIGNLFFWMIAAVMLTQITNSDKWQNRTNRRSESFSFHYSKWIDNFSNANSAAKKNFYFPLLKKYNGNCTLKSSDHHSGRRPLSQKDRQRVADNRVGYFSVSGKPLSSCTRELIFR